LVDRPDTESRSPVLDEVVRHVGTSSDLVEETLTRAAATGRWAPSGQVDGQVVLATLLLRRDGRRKLGVRPV
jgi:hypothetical protein